MGEEIEVRVDAVEWIGGECPVPKNTPLIVRNSNGRKFSTRAKYLDWNAKITAKITAYSILRESEYGWE